MIVLLPSLLAGLDLRLPLQLLTLDSPASGLARPPPSNATWDADPGTKAVERKAVDSATIVATVALAGGSARRM